jgi:hypothetical protein
LLQSDLGEFEDAEFHFDRHEPTRADDGVTDPYSINFEPRTVAESMALSDKIQDDLIERDIDATGELEELCVILIERLEIKNHLKELQLSIKLCGPHVDAFVESHKLIPCIPHLEQRVGLKMLTLTYTEGRNRFVTVAEQNVCIVQMENVMNTKVFGTPDSPSMWYFPLSVQEGEGQLYSMGDIYLPNTKVCKVMLCMNMIAEVCIVDKMR